MQLPEWCLGEKCEDEIVNLVKIHGIEMSSWDIVACTYIMYIICIMYITF